MAHGGEPGPLLEFLGLDSIDNLQYLTTSDLDDQFRVNGASPATRAKMRKLFHSYYKPTPCVSAAPSTVTQTPQIPLSTPGQPQTPSLLVTDNLSLSGTDSAHDTTSTKYLNVVRCITLPNNTPYRGRTDDRSITSFLNNLYQEVVQADLSERQAWLLLLRAFDEPAKTSLRQAVQRSCLPRDLWMKDYAAMVREGASWAEQEYHISNSHDNLDDKFDDFKQHYGETVLALADRLSLLKYEADSVGYSVTDAQLLRVYRRSLYPRLRTLASTIYAGCDTVDDLANRLHRHLRQNPDFNKNSKSHGTASRPSGALSTDSNPVKSADNAGPSRAPTRGPPLSQPLRDFCLTNNVCMYYVANGICRRPDCPYKHEKPPQSDTSTTSSSQVVKSCTTLSSSPIPAHCTLRCPAFGALRLEVDTGCTRSVITHTAALHLQRHLPSSTLTLVDPVAFDTASHEGGLISHCLLHTTLTVYDSSGNPHHVAWSPYVTHSLLAGSSDGLLGRDVIGFGPDCTLVVPTSTGPVPASILLCTLGDTVTPVSTSPTSLQAVPQAYKPPPLDFVDPEALRDMLSVDPTFHPLPVDWSLETVVFQTRWLRLSLVRTTAGTSFFYVDISQQAHSFAQTLQPPACRKVHYKWVKCPADGRADCEAKLQAFVDTGQLRPIPDSEASKYTTNFYGVRGRKRWRPVLPLIATNAYLRALMKADPIPNQQHKLRTCLSRLRLATTVTIHDVSDAFMRFRVSPALGSFFQVYWRKRWFQFTRMIYGSSIAPSCLEGGMSHVEHGLVPTPDTFPPPPVLTDDGNIDLVLDQLLDVAEPEPDQCSFMDDILDFRADTTSADILPNKYDEYDLPLKSQALTEASAGKIGLIYALPASLS